MDIKMTPNKQTVALTLKSSALYISSRLFILTAFAACALSINTKLSAGEITGVVSDAASSSILIGASVQIQETGRSTSTSDDGSYAFFDLPAGKYTLIVSSMGFETASVTVVVPETEEVRRDVRLSSDIVKMEKYVVGGTREGQAKAFQQKQTAPNMLDIISADAAGKLPDGSAAEALKRLPGVVAEVDQNEARYIVIRGMDSALNNVTINGQTIGTPDGLSRAVAMDSVAADLISRIELTKAVTPDMDHNAIGGSINIVTPSPFDRKDTFATASAGLGHSDLKDDRTYNFSATYGTLLGENKKWGIVIGTSFSSRDYGSYRMSGPRWWKVSDYLPATLSPEETTFYNPVKDTWVPDTQTFYNYNLNRRRGGINASLECRPNENVILYAKINYNMFRDDEDREGVENAFYTYPGATDITNRYPSTNADNPYKGNIPRARVNRAFRSYKHTEIITNYQIGSDIRIGAGKLQFNLSNGRADHDTPRRIDWNFRSDTSTDFGATFDATNKRYVVTPKNIEKWDDMSLYKLRNYRFRTDKRVEDIWAGSVDYRLDNNLFNAAGYWKVGARILSREKEKDKTQLQYDITTASTARTLAYWKTIDPSSTKNYVTLADFNIGKKRLDDNFYNGHYYFGPAIDFNKACEFADKYLTTFLDYGASGTEAANRNEDFEVGEDVYAAYLMREIHWGAWTILFGVRYERTQADYTAWQRLNGATDYRLVSGKNSYDDLMPGVHLRYSPRKSLVFRASWTNTLGRPAYADLAGYEAYDFGIIQGDVENPEANGQYSGGISAGNPKLKPYRSMNFDLGVEWYLKQTGILSVGVFHKTIKNPIYDWSEQLKNYQYDGKLFWRFTRARPENADTGHVTGLEINYQQYLTFLPRPFDGLGFGANYTVTDSDVTANIPSGTTVVRREATFFKQAKGAGNIALYYEKYRINARVALNYSGKYLNADGLSADPMADDYTVSRTTVDAKVSVKLNKNWTIYAEIQNIGKEPLRTYAGEPRFLSGDEAYSWTASLGVTWKM